MKDKQSEASEKDVGCVILKKSTSPVERRGAEVQLSRSGPIARCYRTSPENTSDLTREYIRPAEEH
jgi:hypothetical protein